MSNSNQIVGLVRFSYISKGGFAHSHDSQQEQESMIYDADRMERRFKLFEKLALPSLKNQSDPDFQCIFLISKTFPAEYKQRLETLTSTLPGAEIIEKPHMPQYRAMRASYDALRDNSKDWFTSFRLDDDDALDMDFVKRIRRLSVPAAKVKNDGEPVVISCNRGLYLEVGKYGNRIFDACERTPLSVGAAMITPMQNTGKNIYSRNHRKLPAFFNVYSEVTTPAWLRTIHRDNDSVPEFTGVMEKQTDAENAEQLVKHFSHDWDDLMGWRAL